MQCFQYASFIVHIRNGYNLFHASPECLSGCWGIGYWGIPPLPKHESRAARGKGCVRMENQEPQRPAIRTPYSHLAPALRSRLRFATPWHAGRPGATGFIPIVWQSVARACLAQAPDKQGAQMEHGRSESHTCTACRPALLGPRPGTGRGVAGHRC